MAFRGILALLLIGCGNDVSITKQRIDDDSDGYFQDADCDDHHASVHPDASELCDGLDNDCDNMVDEEASDAPMWFVDADGDGWGDEDVSSCSQPDGSSSKNGDCDDTNASISPDAVEHCDGVDEDCDGTVDNDAIDASLWYTDADADGYGAGLAGPACTGAAGQSANDGDCDDDNDRIHPNAPELDCTDPTDYNCDGSVGYADADADGTPACEDCNDADASAHPGATEVCDGADDDCDGSIDNGVLLPFYQDGDTDGFGDAGRPTEACTPPSGYTSDATDCDDADATIYPSAAEFCDGQDHDCDGLVLESSSVDTSLWYADSDGDFFGGGGGVYACTAPPGHIADGTDCGDNDATIYPGAPERCDGVDQDCDGTTDNNAVDATFWYSDADGDSFGHAARAQSACSQPAGYVANATDCNDTLNIVNPAATEVCDASNTDEDCDGLADDADSSATGKSTWYADNDGDGYGGIGATSACHAPAGHLSTSTDCNDTLSAINPGATEVCDSSNTDEDCDGLADDLDSTAIGKTTWYRDADGDGYGGSSSTSVCDQPSGSLSTSTDCNDSLAAINPAATEVCDAANTDEDCDGLADDNDPNAIGQTIWYTDADNDGYPGTTSSRCEPPAGSSSAGGDCDDNAVAVYPGATELCGDSIDQDCTGTDLACAQWSGSAYADAAGYVTKIVGHSTVGNLGLAMAAGDFDGDGLGDLMVGDPDYLYASAYGAAIGYYGPLVPGEWQATANDDWLYYNSSSTYSNLYGSNMANIGDISADGMDDVVVFSGGTVSRLYYGGDTGTSNATSRADRTLTCTHFARLGSWDAATPAEEWLCADRSTGGNQGTVTIYSGTSSVVVNSYTGESGGDYAGAAMGAGDFDGDGQDDIAVGAFGDDDTAAEAGAVYLLYAANRGAANLAAADYKIRGVAAGDGLGTSLKVFDDLNGDGYADLAVGAPSQDSFDAGAGAVYLITTPATGLASSMAQATITGAVSNTFLGGYAVEGGDYDDNGQEDLVLSSILLNSSAGAVWLFYSPPAGSYTVADADAEWLGNNNGDYLGWAVATLPDTNNDGKPELAISGTNGDGLTGNNMGAVCLFLSP